MGDLTTRLSLYLPGGGSSGLILPDEIVDIDRINDNMRKVDAAVGMPDATAVTRPAVPFNGQPIYETDTRRVALYRSAGASWVYPNGNHVIGGVGGLDALTTAEVGDIAFITTPGAGVTGPLMAQVQSGSGAAAVWVIVDTVIADTKANLDLFITAVAATGSVRFNLGGGAYLTSNLVRYSFLTNIGALSAVASSTIKPSAAVGGGAVINADGSVTFTAATTLALQGLFSADFDSYGFLLNIESTSVAADLAFTLQTAAAVELVAGYNTTRIGYSAGAAAVISYNAASTLQPLGRSNGADGTVISGQVNRPFRAVRKTYKADGYDFAGNTQQSSGFVTSPLSYTGAIFKIVSAGTLTGTVRFWGI